MTEVQIPGEAALQNVTPSSETLSIFICKTNISDKRTKPDWWRPRRRTPHLLVNVFLHSLVRHLRDAAGVQQLKMRKSSTEEQKQAGQHQGARQLVEHPEKKFSNKAQLEQCHRSQMSLTLASSFPLSERGYGEGSEETTPLEDRTGARAHFPSKFGPKRGSGRMTRVMLKCMFVLDVVEKKQTTLACVNTKSNTADLVTTYHTFEAHVRRCEMLGLEHSAETTGKLA